MQERSLSISLVRCASVGLLALITAMGSASAGDCWKRNAMGKCGGPDEQTGTIYCYTNTEPIAALCISHPYQVERGQTIVKCVVGTPGKSECQINAGTVQRLRTTYECVGDSATCDGVSVQPIADQPELIEECLIDVLSGSSC